MRSGFTTGSCAAAAAKAASYMLFAGKEKNSIQIITPVGKSFDARIVDIVRDKDMVSCAVIKDGGDDPDITTGVHVVARVSLGGEVYDRPHITIDGGRGVGRVTKPGLDQPIGNAAINHVPREMIEKEVTEICDLFDYTGEVSVLIEVPEGAEIGAKTFNPRLGIEGGISILGTSGIVEPMSSQALLDTIYVELKQQRAIGYEKIVISPGNYGMDFMKAEYNYDLDKSVKCSNYIGDTIDMVRELGFKEVLLVGHIGKLVKLSGGIMNTHSKIADMRMELIVEAATACGGSEDICNRILECVVTEEAVRVLETEGLRSVTMNTIMDKCMQHLRKRAGDTLGIECIMYSNEQGLLAQSSGARRLMDECIMM